MATPRVPGFPGADRQATLADAWLVPPGSYPQALWPRDRLREVTRYPVGWITVVQHFFEPQEHGGAGCVLIAPNDEAAALRRPEWLGHSIGEVGIWDDGGFDDGLVMNDRDIEVGFFAQVRHPTGGAPLAEIEPSFLWYWDAFRVKDGWHYLNHAGRELDLVRWAVSEEAWKVEVRALEFRHYLADRQKSALLQRDYVEKVEAEPFDRLDDELTLPWAHFDLHMMHDRAMGGRPAFSRLLGQYVLPGQRNEQTPRFQDRAQDRDYPAFIYSLDDESGQPLRYSCDPEVLGTYFDNDESRPHYLTPVYFRSEVLQQYAAEPERYAVTATRLRCLDLWSVSISFNSEGLVEVYLGDIGRDLPSDEWGHWLAHNVPPAGVMDEGRFRRDFLGQWASSPDPIGDLRRAREEAAEASVGVLGTPVWRPLDPAFAPQWEHLVGPLTADGAGLVQPVLTLAKALVDALDSRLLRRNTTSAPADQSLVLLERYLTGLGGEADLVQPLRALQAVRSRGGIAHLPNSASAAAMQEFVISDGSPRDIFLEMVRQLTSSLNAITARLRSSTSAGATEDH